MAGIADFLDSLIGGFDLICYSLAIGSLFWGLFVLRPWHQQEGASAVLLQKTVTLIYKGGFWLAAAQFFKIILKIWLMTCVLIPASNFSPTRTCPDPTTSSSTRSSSTRLWATSRSCPLRPAATPAIPLRPTIPTARAPTWALGIGRA